MTKVLNPRPTIYKGTRMRSRLEAGFAGWLDRELLSWEYEPFAVGDEHGQYLPDFLVRELIVWPDEGRFSDAAVEVKATRDHVDIPRLKRAATQLASAGRGGALVVVVGDTGHTFAVCPGEGPPIEMAWVFVERDAGLSSAVAFRSFEPPFCLDWWKD